MKSLIRIPQSAASGNHQPEREGDRRVLRRSHTFVATATEIPQYSAIRC